MAGLAVFAASAQIRIATPNTEMIIDGELGGDLCFMYYGNILSDTDMESLSAAGVPWNDVYPVYGIWTDGERALEVTHSDGNLSNEEMLFIGQVGQAMGIELEKIAQISQWIIDYLVWIENSKIIFEEN